MLPSMRRARQALSPAACEAILERGTSGVLALSGDDGYPYAVPISYVYADGKLYFHCAKTGHKLDAIRRSGKASFCVIGRDQVVPEEYTTYYRSVIAFGEIRIMEAGAAFDRAADALARKYAPEDSRERRRRYLEDYRSNLCMLEMTLHQLTGKEARELMEQR